MLQLLCKVDQPGDHLGRRDGLVRVAHERFFERLAEFLALHEVRPLRNPYLIVQQFSQGFEGKILMLECGDALKEFITQYFQPHFTEACRGKEVDDIVGINGIADDQANGMIDLTLASMSVATAVLGKSLADHGLDALEERQVLDDGLRFRAGRE